MIRAAAKNWQDVAVVVSPADYDAILDELSVQEARSEHRNVLETVTESLGDHSRL